MLRLYIPDMDFSTYQVNTGMCDAGRKWSDQWWSNHVQVEIPRGIGDGIHQSYSREF